MNALRGTGVALVTPFDAKNEVDETALTNLVNHAIKSGVDFLVVMGTTAEAVTLKKDEKEKVKRIIEETNNQKLPLVLGIGGNDTLSVTQEINNTNLSNYEAILSVSPYYNKPTQEGIYEHYRYIAEHTDHPIILYNVPGRTGSNIESRTSLRLAKDFKNIIGVKEANPHFSQSLEIISHKPDDFLFFSGDDALAPTTTLAGGDGVISVIGQAIPEYSEMINLALSNNANETYAIYYKISSLISSIYKEGNPCGVKALLELKGICSRYTRLPLIQASQNLVDEIKANMIF